MAETEERTYRVDLMKRVEGEGRFTLRMRGDEVLHAELSIFEAPRFFEAFLVGRSVDDVPDIVARICGICPVAYQLSAGRALEAALGVTTTPAIEALRRILYCGEWIESHALHIFMLHAPDFYGCDSAIELAQTHRDLVERGLRIRKVGNQLIEAIGGRASHPVSPRVGGFSKAADPGALRALLPALESAMAESVQTVEWTTALPYPSLELDYVFVALESGGAYPLEAGETVLVSGRDPVPVSDWDTAMQEQHVAHSNALQARLADGTAYLCGPQARLFHHYDRLHPAALEAAQRVGLERNVRNPHRSIIVRAVELVHALAEAVDLIRAYVAPAPSAVPLPVLQGTATSTGTGATEAPRGLLFHRYDLAPGNLIARARIVPPTSQNQARIEEDLRGLGPSLRALPHAEATSLCERVIRAYDPCISCATHFLDLRIEDAP